MNNENQKLKSSIDRRFDNYQPDLRIPSFGIADIKILIFEFGKDFDKKLEKFVSKEEFKAHADHMDKRFEHMDKRLDSFATKDFVDAKINHLRSELKEDISFVRSDMLKMNLASIGILAALMTLFKFFV